jgi:hypothetical protein
MSSDLNPRFISEYADPALHKLPEYSLQDREYGLLDQSTCSAKYY